MLIHLDNIGTTSGKSFMDVKAEPDVTDTDGLTKQAVAGIPLSVGV